MQPAHSISILVYLSLQREMLALGEAGYKEVTLLGQNIDAYGRDLPGAAADGSGRRAWTFTDLLHYVHDVPGIERIRFATSHPRYAVKKSHRVNPVSVILMPLQWLRMLHL